MPKIDHLGIAVHSIADARRFYEAAGFDCLHEEVVQAEGVRTARIPLEDSQIELLEPLAAATPVGRFLARRGEGLHHVALHVEDISAVFERMKTAGIKLLSEDIRIGAGGHLYFFIHPQAASGVLMEICQDPIADV